MKEFVAGKVAMVEIKEVAEKVTRETSRPHGVRAVIDYQNFTVIEITVTPDETVAFRHTPVTGQSTNVIIIAKGIPFMAEVLAGHLTLFRGC